MTSVCTLKAIPSNLSRPIFLETGTKNLALALSYCGQEIWGEVLRNGARLEPKDATIQSLAPRIPYAFRIE